MADLRAIRIWRLLSRCLRSRFSFSSLVADLGLDAVGRNVELGRPEDRVQDELAEVGVAPVLVGVGAGESEAAAAVGAFDGPGEHLVAALGVDDVLVRAAGRGRHALPGLVVRLGERSGVTPFISGRKRMLKYHSSRMANGLTPRVIGCSGSLMISAVQCGLVEKPVS